MKHIFKSLALATLMIGSSTEASVLTQQERTMIRDWVSAEYKEAPVEIKKVATIARSLILDLVNAVEETLDVLIENPNLVSQYQDVFQKKSQHIIMKLQASAAEVSMNREGLDQYMISVLTRIDSDMMQQFDAIISKLQLMLIDVKNQFQVCKTPAEVKKLKTSFQLIKEDLLFVLDAIN